MKKRIFCLALGLAVALMSTPALAVNCGNVDSVPAAEVCYGLEAEDMPLEEPTVDWDTAAAFANYTVVTCGDDYVEEPIVVSVVDLNQAKQDNLTYTVDGQVMVPLRVVAENMGYTVEWNEEAQAATINGNDINFTVRIGESCPSVAAVNANGDVADSISYDISVSSDFVYDVADEDLEIADELKADDENSANYADGVSYSAYDVITVETENAGVAEIQSADGKTYAVKYAAENAKAVDGGEMTYTITTIGNAKATLVNGKTYVPASMFSVMNYTYDEAGNCFTFGKVNG